MFVISLFSQTLIRLLCELKRCRMSIAKEMQHFSTFPFQFQFNRHLNISLICKEFFLCALRHWLDCTRFSIPFQFHSIPGCQNIEIQKLNSMNSTDLPFARTSNWIACNGYSHWIHKMCSLYTILFSLVNWRLKNTHIIIIL